MELFIGNEKYEVIDSKEKITIADSFVVAQNKIGTAHGEKKLYLGQDNSELRKFFGERGFNINCFLLKKDLIKYLEETHAEYSNPEQPYLNKERLSHLWGVRKEKIIELNNLIEFKLVEQMQITGPRVYAKSSENAFQLIREISLPNITYISIVKIKSAIGEIKYYFRLFVDYFGEAVHPYIISEQNKTIEGITNQENRLLRASHIKPWSKSNNKEKVDPYNGFMFTPTFDHLFDSGFISFSDDKKILLSPFLSNFTYSILRIHQNKKINRLPIEGRKAYLEYHREEIFKK